MENTNWIRGTCIGRGSYGTVNLAVNKFDGRVFAVKSVNRNSGLDCQIVALENEIRILKSLSSPYIVEYIRDDITFESGASYRNIHMEYLPGGTVTDAVKCSGVDEKSLRSYAWCIVSALRYIHSKGIVHCDVKGRNVLVGSSAGTAKLADFGSATATVRCTSPIGVRRGSPLWMAPEVVRGEYQGPESDVWSLGCTIIEMVTGKPAWDDEGVDTIMKIGYSGELPEFPVQLSELGRDFVEKCLRREVGERWSCDQLLQHPFLLPCSSDGISNTKWSPRCVFDFADLNFSDEEEEEVSEKLNFEVKDRIGKLASTVGAIWESDGWLEVRNLNPNLNRANTEEVVETGTSSRYPDLMRANEENNENTVVNWRVNWEYFSNSNASSSHSLGEPSTCDHCSIGARRAAGLSCTNVAINYSCYQIVVLLLLNLFMYYDYILKDYIIINQSFTFNILQLDVYFGNM